MTLRSDLESSIVVSDARKKRKKRKRGRTQTAGVFKDFKDAWKLRQGERRVEKMLKGHQEHNRRQGERRRS